MTDTASTTVFRFPLDGGRATVGRDPSCTLCLQGMGISRQHAVIVLNPQQPVIIDSGSTFGVRIDNCPVEQGPLSGGAVLTLGIHHFTVEIAHGDLLLVRCDPDKVIGATPAAQQKSEMKVGRDQRCDILLNHPMVSRLHAAIRREPRGSLVIADNGSANGTFVNGRPVHTSVIAEGDIIQIGPYRLFVENGQVLRADDLNRIRLEAFNLCIRTGNTILLNDVNLTIASGEFVVILGASGAGKTTLARALTGQVTPWRGDVYANGLPLRRFQGAFSQNIGYVSQENLLYRELTVDETFREQSLLRLPRDSSPGERSARIDEVIDLLDLRRVARHKIMGLSGGEAKRVHLGIELLASPAVIFLDEPLAGLDPGLVRRFMQLFRRIADRGHTLVLTTHTLEQVELSDRLIFMHRGKVLFQGPQSDLAQNFGVKSLAEVYEQVTSKEPKTIAESTGPEQSRPKTPLHNQFGLTKPRRPRTISGVKQWFMLSQRYRRILLRDRRNALLMLVQAPLIATLLNFVFKGGQNGFLPISFYFCITISAIWIGGVNSIREIAREWSLLLRERRAGLSVASYVGAKLVVSGFLGGIQAILLVASLSLFFDDFAFCGTNLILIGAGTVSGILLGLGISSCSGNVSRAINLLPILFIPQIFFSGILIPFDRMTVLGRILSHLTVSRPIFSLFKQVRLLEQELWIPEEWLALGLLNAGIIILVFLAIGWRLARSGRR